MTEDESRPVLMSVLLADMLGVLDRATSRTDTECVVRVTEAEILGWGGSRVEWGYPDAKGRFTPTIYADSAANVPR